MTTFRDRVALVTGAGSGIGRALAEQLAQAGAIVIATDRDGAALDGLSSHGRVEAEALDITDRDAFFACAEAVRARHGHIDLLFNNAGVGLAGELHDTRHEDWRRVFEVNLFGVVHGIEAVYPAMQARGRGHIVNVSSGAGLLPRPGMVAYAASKHAVVGLSTSLRAEASDCGVRVTAVCPGYVATSILSSTTWRGVDGAKLRKAIPVEPMSAARCASLILRATAANRAVVTIGALARLEWLAFRLWPRAMTRASRLRLLKMRSFRS